MRLREANKSTMQSEAPEFELNQVGTNIVKQRQLAYSEQCEEKAKNSTEYRSHASLRTKVPKQFLLYPRRDDVNRFQLGEGRK